jgi:formate hydrogenlyase subunit 3/multisubunit Na+/H+ antiporter MnhD subunit
MSEVPSLLPIALCVIPAVLAVVTYPLARLARAFGPALSILGAGATTALAVPMAIGTIRGQVFVGLGRELRADALSAVLVLVVSGISLAAAVYAVRYMRFLPLLERVRDAAGADVTERRLARFYALSLAFLATMLWASLTNNIVMLYVSVEASTIASGLLVAFYWDRRSLEAAYKYLMLLTVGIAFALFGCVLLYAAAVPHLSWEAGVRGMLISDLSGVAGQIPRNMALLIMACFIVGFGTKAGIAPFHPWLPDAHAEAPSPVSALLSGVMIKTAIYALVRTIGIFFPIAAYHPVSVFVIVLGAFTMLLGGVMCLAQDDLKRLLAYSSVSQMGYIVLGIGLVGIGFGQAAGYLGGYGGLFHLLNHALSKALLFLAVGAMIYTTAGGRRMSELSGLARRMPATAVCFFVAAFAISGMPPFNGFWSKLTLYLGAAEARLWWALGIAIATSVLTLIAFVRAGYQVFWSDAESASAPAEVVKTPLTMLIPMGVLAVLCVALGLFPQLVYPLLDPAARALAGVF